MSLYAVCHRFSDKVWEGELEVNIVGLDKQVKNPVGVVRELGQPHPTFTEKDNEQNRHRTQRAGKHQKKQTKIDQPTTS